MVFSSLHQDTGFNASIQQLVEKRASGSVPLEPLEVHRVTNDPLDNEAVGFDDTALARGDVREDCSLHGELLIKPAFG
jgi:hypothetical protein